MKDGNAQEGALKTLKKEYMYLCTVVADIPYRGRQFRLKGKAELAEFGFSVGSVRQKLLRGREGVLMGIHLKAMLVSEFRKTPQLRETYRTDWREISQLFKQSPVLFRQRRKPLIGEVVEGPYHGEIIALLQVSDVSPYFCVTSTSRAARNGDVYGGIRWRYAKDRAESGMPPLNMCEQHDILVSLSQRSKQGRLHRQQQTGFAVASQSVHYLLMQSRVYLLTGTPDEHIEGVILLHRALGLYQTQMAWKYEGTLIGRRFNYLAALLEPNERKNTLTQNKLINNVTGLLIRQLAEK